MKVMRGNPKTFQAAVQSALAEQNLTKRFQLRKDDSQSSKSRTEEPMEIDHIRPLCILSWGGQLALADFYALLWFYPHFSRALSCTQTSVLLCL